jgi:dihydrofolate reductase
MAPRRIVTFNWVTADGYFAGADGNLDWVVPDEEQARAAAEGISAFDRVVFGRRTYERFEGSGGRPSSTSSAPFQTPIIRDDDRRNTAPWRSR